MTHEQALWLHIAVGSSGLLFYWGALLSRKGGLHHRAWGRPFFVTLLAVALSVAPLLYLRSGRLDPAHAVQFSYLALCLTAVTMLAWTAIRWKDDPERFRGPHFKLLGPLLLILGTVVLAAGLTKRDPLPAFLSWVGLFHGALMIRFAWNRAPLLPNWWLNWHMTAACSLFTAVHGTFLFVAWRWIFMPDAGHHVAVAFHALVLVIAVWMRLWFGARYGVPLRFTRRTASVHEAKFA